MKLTSMRTFGLVNNIGPSWFYALEAEFTKPYFEKLSKFVRDERAKYTVYPPVSQVFSWTQVTPIHEVKVVIVGQDPYHQPNQAHGLCFSVQKGVDIPPSLKNMYKELEQSCPPFRHPGHGYLMGWAEQGVLLLNSVLTVRRNEANSHKDAGWELFTDAVMNWLNFNLSGVVFMLWGSYAHKKGDKINKTRHHVIKGVHPSPLSAHRGFFGCGHFKMCNELLKKQNKPEINWNHLP
ncbi:hypothetical protein HELRODRAFT_157191 [Helobdella robusta]|uniref:Uracil-DNA glycosylase n=1 Tax=Helobdella robusta TaxID=6412 RepID=T1EM77_HELRO|nr:hypothetical protein HELRODRAFT_157191 [Helobdella robusta]ESO01588.1 hypothetical protein HELRODRAFT_157191 [Helobdella robusta]